MWSVLLILMTLYGGDVSELRAAYAAQDEVVIERLWSSLDSKKNLNNVERCYYHAFTCLMAKYSSNPYSKLKYFNQGYAGLNKMVVADPSNVELRYHRYMIERNAPSFLIDTDHTKRDLQVIRNNLTDKHPLYDLISKTVDI